MRHKRKVLLNSKEGVSRFMPDYKSNSRAAFNKQAAVYDSSHFSRFPRECYPIVVEEVSKHTFRRVLDLGCGTGVLLQRVIGKFPDCTAEGLDLSEEMLNVARERLGTSAGLTTGDAENMPYRDGEFDLVMCTESFHHFPQPEKALQEIYRVLRFGGCFVLCDAWFPTPLRQAMNVFLPFSKSGDVRIYSERELTGLIRDAGFARVCWRKITERGYICVGYKEGLVPDEDEEEAVMQRGTAVQ